MDTPPECLLDFAARKALYQGAAAHAQPEAEPQPCATPECFLPCARDAERTLAAKRSIAASLRMFDRSHARVKALLQTMAAADDVHTELAHTSDSEDRVTLVAASVPPSSIRSGYLSGHAQCPFSCCQAMHASWMPMRATCHMYTHSLSRRM